MKYIILIGDGMGDLPLPELDNRTPLAAAATPAMDFLSRNGELYLVKTIPDGFAAGSDIANLSLLGYRPEEFYTGRAPLEAAGMGIALQPDEIAWRCNLVNLDGLSGDKTLMNDFSAGNISTAEAHQLIDAINRAAADSSLRFHPGLSYRHLLITGNGFSGLATVPPHDYTGGRDVTKFWKQYFAVPRLRELLERVMIVLAEHEVNKQRIAAGRKPANAIWLWGEGRVPAMPTINELYGISGALISAVDLLKGIAVYGGLEVIEVPGATGDLNTNFAGKARAAVRAAREKDLVFVHVEAPDEAGHQGSVAEKIRAIESFDARVVRPVLDELLASAYADQLRIVVGMDHYTPVSTMSHAEFPAPVAIYDSSGKGPGSGLDFTEKNAVAANRLLASGQAFFEKLLQKS